MNSKNTTALTDDEIDARFDAALSLYEDLEHYLRGCPVGFYLELEREQDAARDTYNALCDEHDCSDMRIK